MPVAGLFCLDRREYVTTLVRHRADKGASLCCASRTSPADPSAKAQTWDWHRVVAASVVACSVQFWSSAAAGASDYAWRPRRHYRRMDEQRRDANMLLQLGPSRERGPARHAEKGSIWNTFRDAAEQAQDQVSHALQPRQRQWDEQPQTIRHAQPLPSPSAQVLSAVQSTTGILAVSAALLGILLVIFKDKLRLWNFGRQRPAGRWIRDRSLGGKMVFIPEGELPAQRKKSLWDDDAAAPTSQPAAAARPVSRTPAQQLQLPQWWDPPPRVPADDSYRDAASSKARSIVRQLEDGKVAGRDYPLAALAELRQTCNEAGISVKARTDSGRDAMYKAAMEFAASAALMQGADATVSGTALARFVTGVAAAVGVPDEKAGSMAQGIVASRSQALLIDLCAAVRERRSGDKLFLLLQLAGLLSAFALPQHSAQAEMVAARLEQRYSLEERKEILEDYHGIDPARADRMAELLGFDPALVLSALQQPQSGASGLAPA